MFFIRNVFNLNIPNMHYLTLTLYPLIVVAFTLFQDGTRISFI